ncbi:MAG: hypothetical protein JXA03_07575 [Bacteroidales bacterium]|nr:hypothetical protein [Bacteroidales bacterium]
MKRTPENVFLLIATLLLVVISCRKSDYLTPDNGMVIISDAGYGTGTTTWTSDRDYLLDGLVFVNDGQILTIEAGTVVRAKTGQGRDASALIVARGGKIIAEGTSEKPVVLTCENDDLAGSVPVEARGLWGGLIILGNARLNNQYNEAHIEGIPFSEPRGVFGGNNDEDNSGVLKFVSIRHGGTDIGEGNEINGLTLGGVGSETVIEYIEVVSANDDGLECFGGTANLRYVAVAFCGDDALDYDMGYRGMAQFVLIIQDPAHGDLCVEAGGGTEPETGQPFALPLFGNVTFIGRGPGTTGKTIELSRNAGGVFINSVFTGQNQGVFVEYNENPDNSYTRFTAGELRLQANLFFDVAGNLEQNIFNVYSLQGMNLSQQNAEIRAYFSAAGNFIGDPGLNAGDLFYEVIPKNNIHENLSSLPDPWFTVVPFRGAFGSFNWAEGWTLLSRESVIE